MEFLGNLFVTVGVTSIIVWAVKYVNVKRNRRAELESFESKLGYYGMGIMLLGLFIANPSWATVASILSLLGVIGIVLWTVKFIGSKSGSKTPMTKAVKGIGIGAIALFFSGGLISGAAVDADKKSENVSAQLAKADSEKAEKEKAESEAKAKSESDKKAKEKSESEAKEKSEAEAKEKSESEAKVKAESEAKVKAESEAKQEEERAAQAAKEEEKRVAAAQQQAAPKPAAIQAEPQVNNAQGAIIGNVKSMIYHVPGGRSYNQVSPRNQVIFNSEEEAQAAGYRKARN